MHSFEILDSSSNIEVIGTRETTPRLFGIVEILEAHLLFSCWSRSKISSGIPSDITDTRDTIGIIDNRGTIGVFHPAPYGVVDILDAFDIRD